MNLPNAITIIRILLMPLFIYISYSGISNARIYAGIIFILAGISDVLDGYIARKHNLKTDLGAILDPLADKLVVFTVLVVFTHKNIIPVWILIAMGLKEISLIIGAIFLYLFKGNVVMPSDIYGKIATILFYVSIISIVIGAPVKLSRFLLITTVISNITALIHYGRIFFTYEKNKSGNKNN